MPPAARELLRFPASVVRCGCANQENPNRLSMPLHRFWFFHEWTAPHQDCLLPAKVLRDYVLSRDPVHESQPARPPPGCSSAKPSIGVAHRYSDISPELDPGIGLHHAHRLVAVTPVLLRERTQSHPPRSGPQSVSPDSLPVD